MWNCIIKNSLVYEETNINWFYYSCLLKLTLNILHSSPHLIMNKVNFIMIVTCAVMLLIILDVDLIINSSLFFLIQKAN